MKPKLVSINEFLVTNMPLASPLHAISNKNSFITFNDGTSV